jgi:hypothetical protein
MNAEFHSHINEIISKANENTRAGMHASSTAPNARLQTRSQNPYFGEKKNENVFEGKVATSFETSNKNIRNAEEFLPHANSIQNTNSSPNTFGHLMFLKNKQHDYVGEQNLGMADAKARLARIQGKADNYDKDEEKNEIAA